MASSLDLQSTSGSSIILWGSHQGQGRTTRYAQLSEMPPEIMENIFEQLATKSLSAYEPDVKKALLSCLFLSKYLRDFALHRLFQSMEVIAWPSFSRLNLLLEIIDPSSLEWMSVLPYIRHFVFRARCHSQVRVVEPFDP